MVELKLNANLSKLRGQTLESQATEIAGLCRARKWRSGDFMVRARIAKSIGFHFGLLAKGQLYVYSETIHEA